MYNRVILIGDVGPKGIEVRPQAEGTMVAQFMLKTSEVNQQSGKTFATWHVVEAFGKSVSVAQTLQAGDIILVEGSLRRRKQGEAWESVVVGWALQRVQAAAHA